MRKVYTGTSEIEHGLCACTVDNPLVKARGLSLRTGAQTMLYLSLISFKRYKKSLKRDICCFDFRSNFLVSISFLINIGKEMSLPGFRK